MGSRAPTLRRPKTHPAALDAPVAFLETNGQDRPIIPPRLKAMAFDLGCQERQRPPVFASCGHFLLNRRSSSCFDDNRYHPVIF
jgi:hypothetical protein